MQTFKVGPDYLDPTYLTLASGRPCYNLDPWMSGEGYIRALFDRAVADADVAVVEGVMGLFDGAEAASIDGSSAHVARILSADVWLVVNAHGMSRSLAALVAGFSGFEAGVKIAGVIANHVGSPRHEEILAEALQAAGDAPLIGSIGRGAFPELKSRHLGLKSANQAEVGISVLDRLADAVEGGIPQLGELRPLQDRPTTPTAFAHAAPHATIAVACDEAFHFYYRDNLDALEAAGCRIVHFSPLADEGVPAADALYLGGGYPELFAGELEANVAMRQSIRDLAAAGRLVYAECGGLMYLSQAIESEGEKHQMCGVLPGICRMGQRRKRLGYVTATLAEDCIWGARGEQLRGHEFHYSELTEPGTDGWRAAYGLEYRRGERAMEGWLKGNVLASYVHLHWASRPNAVRQFVESIRKAAECGR